MYCSVIDGGHHLEFETRLLDSFLYFQWLHSFTPSTCSNSIITADYKFQTHTHTLTSWTISTSSSSSSLGEYTREIFYIYFMHTTFVAMVTGVG